MRHISKQDIVISAITLLLSSQALAQVDGCIEEDRVYLGRSRDYTQACRLTQPLGMTEGKFDYPLMKNNPQRVHYWLGEYTKTIIDRDNYLRVVTNICTRQELLRQEEHEDWATTVPFLLDNPNLSQDIFESYKLVPMTDVEARAAFERLKLSCERYRGN